MNTFLRDNQGLRALVLFSKSIPVLSRRSIGISRHTLLTLLIIICSIQVSLAQRFPITVVPQVNPPAPVNFHNYADATTINSPLQVQLLLSDISVSNLQVRLKVSFEGNGISFESRDLVVGAQPLFIDGGSPLVLRNTDLGPYFEFQNLQGITANLYGQTIPEGSYQFCFEVFEFVTGNRLSSKTCATTYIFKNEPPILNLPLNGTNMEPQAVDNIVFQWTPRHINVSNVEYELSIVEIWDDGVDPQTAFLSSPPIFQTTTRANSFVYGPTQPQLLTDKRYAWQVQAKAIQGAEEIGLFKNEGKSEIFWFSKVEPCETPLNVSAEPKGISKMNVYWDEDPTTYTEYAIAYREVGRENAQWFTMRTNSAWATVWDLKPGTTYEYKVKGKCKYQYSEYSEPQRITTETAQDETANYNCGIVPDEIAITNREPVANIMVGDRITAGDFVITITDIEDESNGRITGVGYVRVPYFELARFAVRFSGILINTDYQLAEGEIVTLYDPKFGADAQMTVDVNTNVGEVFNGDRGDTEDQKVDFVISSIEIDGNGAIVIRGENGEEAIIPGGRDITITDSEGTPWTVGEDGTITEGEAAEGGAATTSNTTGVDQNGASQISAKGVRVDFEDSGYYYFDEVPNAVASKLTEKYKTITIAGGGDYTIPFKAVSNISGYTQDVLTARATFADSDLTKDDIIFKTKNGVKVDATWNGDVATLTLTRKFDYAVEEVLATVKPKDTSEQYKIAGVFNMVHLASQELKEINVTLVPINRGVLSTDLKTQINEIYNKAGVNFNITIEEPLTIEKTDWDLNGNNQLDVGDSSLLAQYTEEERAIYKYYTSKKSYDKKRYYVFVLGNSISPSKSIEGFMPLKRQYGFAFDPSNMAKTIAHELGHGVFGLEHPWDTYGFSSESTNWLMDNRENGTVLNHMDWKKMHAAGIELYMFQGDEDGEFGSYQYLVGYNVIPGIFNAYVEEKDKGSPFSFISPAGKIFTVPNTVKDITFGRGGVLLAFTVNENGKEERYIGGKRVKSGSETFTGYIKKFGNDENRNERIFRDIDSKNLSANTNVYVGKLNRDSGFCGIDLYTKTFENKAEGSWNSGGKLEPFTTIDFRNGAALLKERISSPEACDLCADGEKFFNKYNYLIKTDEDSQALTGISKMLCSKGDDQIDYDILVAQINKDFSDQLSNVFWGSDRALFIKARDKFWEQDGALTIYLKALQTVNNNIGSYNEKLGSNASKEEFYSALYYLNDDFINTLTYDQKENLLENIFQHNIFIGDDFFIKGKSDVSLIKKVIRSIDDAYIDGLLDKIINGSERHKPSEESGLEQKRDVLYEIINALEFERLQQTNINIKVEALSRMLNGNLFTLFGTNYQDIITKLLKSVSNEEAGAFLKALEDPKESFDDDPLVFHLKERLTNFLSNNSYTKFFEELLRLTGARAEESPDTYTVVGDLTWDVENKNYVLVSYVRDRNNYKYSYDNSTHKVNIVTCENPEETLGNCSGAPVNLIPANSSPFDLVMIHFFKDVSPFSPIPENSIYQDRPAIEGKGYAVPVIFIEHLKNNISEARLKNTAWNTFNIVITVATLGEGAAAISAVRVAAASSRLAANAGSKILLRTIGRNAFALMDFTFTVGSTAYQFGTGDNLPKEFQWVGYFFAAKGAYDLVNGGLKGLATMSKASPNQKKELIKAYNLVNNKGKEISVQELDDIITRSIKRLEDSSDPNLRKAWDEAKIYNVGAAKTDLLAKIPTTEYGKIKKFIDDLDISDPSLHTLNLLPEDKLLKLASDFERFSDGLKIKFKDPDFIEGWSLISKRAEMRLDDEILSSLRVLVKNHKGFVQGYSDELTKIFDKLAEARGGCTSCPSSNSNIDDGVGMIKDIIEDLDEVIVKVGDNATGLGDFLREMGQTAKKAKAGTFTLKTLNAKWTDLTSGGYKFSRFEGNIPDIDTGHKLDVLFFNPNTLKSRAIELKNWKNVSAIPSGSNSQFYKYLQSGKEFRYYFNGNTEQAKTAFQNIFKNSDKAKELFEVRPGFFTKHSLPNGTRIRSWEEVKSLADDGLLINHSLFDFIY
ncbi:fibronectin type III domain-containing protein [Aquimarina sp. U1-2]|uniref:fibronectin type III domain-containing protein n=1 Tax=Aquimarina sp. U1-2 TaxID=2823141 RepID=UPI001AEC7E7F|nr:fibronectin type III domain-containing protein [Aquimarina sp. U1-2]MBP2834032.1 fibronectin type III domain-containing protein [Aquimarina sp. U1-2]